MKNVNKPSIEISKIINKTVIDVLTNLAIELNTTTSKLLNSMDKEQLLDDVEIRDKELKSLFEKMVREAIGENCRVDHSTEFMAVTCELKKGWKEEIRNKFRESGLDI